VTNNSRPIALRGAVPGSGFDYGNARLRARRAQLLDGKDFRELYAAGSADRMLGALRSTAYERDLERALVHRGPLRRIDETVRHHLVRSLGDLRRFYEGRAAAGIELLLGRWDRHNLVTIVRTTARPTVYRELDSLVVPAGTVGAGPLAELASQPSLRSAIELMVAWDLPSRRTSRRLLAEWPRYAASNDPMVLEEVLQRAWAESVDDALGDWEGSDLEEILRSEIDLLNLLSTLRRRDDEGPAPTDPEDTLLVGGTLRPRVLDEVHRASDRAQLVAALAGHRLPEGWSGAFEQWSSDDDLAGLAGRLERALAGRAIGLFGRGDPLGISIPIAYASAKECEARNIRLVGRALVHRLPLNEVEEDLFPW